MMVIPELLLSTSILSLALFVWAVLAKYKKEGNLSSASTGDDSGSDEGEGEAEEEEDRQHLLESCGSSVCGDGFMDETPLSSTPGTPKISSGLSRRQRRNRKKEEKGTKKSKSPKLSRTSSEEMKSPELPRSKKHSQPCKQYSKLNLPDQEIYQLLTGYELPLEERRQLSFPMDSSLYPGKAYIYRDPESSLLPETGDQYDDGDLSEEGTVTLDATAEPFYPDKSYTYMLKSSYSESTGVLSATAKEFVPSESTESKKKPLQAVQSSPLLNSESGASKLVSVNSLPNLSDQSIVKESRSIETILTASISSRLSPVVDVERKERRCVRCSRSFYMTSSGEYFSQETCTYHWGKLRSHNKLDPTYQCCGTQAGTRSSSRGCTSAELHVWSGLPLSRGIFGPLDGYVKTKHRKNVPKDGMPGVYGVDCEMCYTSVGLELTKVTVVGIDGRLVYESLVTPENEIIDYNTRFSGITERELNRGTTKTIKEVQNDLNGFINADSILIGHGLENDLRALNLIHTHIIDTSLVFPHFYGLPYRRSLRSLTNSYLKRDIQDNAWGHDSYEDARACVELMLWKARKDMEKMKKLNLSSKAVLS